MAKRATPALGWLGERFQQYLLEHDLLFEPLTKSRISGAERGEARLSFERGAITAVVGSSWSGHTVTLKLKPLTDREWKKAVAAIAADAEVARRLLCGAPGLELERVLAAAQISLFPTERTPALRCNCSTPWDCRHARVLAVRGARLLDANPFLWLEVLGRPREALLANVRAQMSDQAATGGRMVPVSAERFFTTEVDPDSIAVRPGATVAPDALLKLLGPLPVPALYRNVSYMTTREVVRQGRRFPQYTTVKETADEVVARYLASISQTAAELAAGDRAPVYAGEAGAGKRVPLKHRLVQEIEEAAVEAGTLLSLTQLHAACPTTAAWQWQTAVPALAEALTVLGPEFMTLAGAHVGLRSAVLTGATFRHAITVTEWQRGRLSFGSDWERLLAIAGFMPPFDIAVGGATCRVLDPEQQRGRDDLFKALQPQVGDELHLTVTDPEQPALTGSLVRLAERKQANRTDCDRAAAQQVVLYLVSHNGWAIAEQDAVEVLLANGFYRDGNVPAPVWLLPAATREHLHWGGDRSLCTASWYAREPALFRPPLHGVWAERQGVISQFVAGMLKDGRPRRDLEFARACLDAWCQVWPGDQRHAHRRPTLGALAHFLWNVAPLQFRADGLALLEVISAWFRFLAGHNAALQVAYREHLALCELGAAYSWRVQTVPARRDKDAMAAWLLEGYRWLGPELLFQ